MINTNVEDNKKILNRLFRIVDNHPELRFHQILYIYKICEPDIDKYYEESGETLRKLRKEIIELEDFY